KDNGEPIKQVVVRFRLWCLAEGLYGREVVAIDGSKFKAQNNSERNYTQKKLATVIKREQARVEKYLQELDEGDAAEAAAETERAVSAEELREKLKHLRPAPSQLLLLPHRPHPRSEEHTSELQSPYDLVCRLLLEKKK